MADGAGRRAHATGCLEQSEGGVEKSRWGQGQDDEEDEELRRAIEESKREMQLHDGPPPIRQAFSSFGSLKHEHPPHAFLSQIMP